MNSYNMLILPFSEIFEVFDSCDTAFATWSDGESIIVKDPEGFVAKVIPRYYNQNCKFYS